MYSSSLRARHGATVLASSVSLIFIFHNSKSTLHPKCYAPCFSPCGLVLSKLRLWHCSQTEAKKEPVWPEHLSRRARSSESYLLMKVQTGGQTVSMNKPKWCSFVLQPFAMSLWLTSPLSYQSWSRKTKTDTDLEDNIQD